MLLLLALDERADMQPIKGMKEPRPPTCALIITLMNLVANYIIFLHFVTCSSAFSTLWNICFLSQSILKHVRVKPEVVKHVMRCTIAVNYRDHSMLDEVSYCHC